MPRLLALLFELAASAFVPVAARGAATELPIIEVVQTRPDDAQRRRRGTATEARGDLGPKHRSRTRAWPARRRGAGPRSSRGASPRRAPRRGPTAASPKPLLSAARRRRPRPPPPLLRKALVEDAVGLLRLGRPRDLGLALEREERRDECEGAVRITISQRPTTTHGRRLLARASLSVIPAPGDPSRTSRSSARDSEVAITTSLGDAFASTSRGATRAPVSDNSRRPITEPAGMSGAGTRRPP
jgi:hypothetical protein